MRVRKRGQFPRIKEGLYGKLNEPHGKEERKFAGRRKEVERAAG